MNFPPLVTLHHFINKRILLEGGGYRRADSRWPMNERSTDVPAEKQIKSRASLPRALSQRSSPSSSSLSSSSSSSSSSSYLRNCQAATCRSKRKKKAIIASCNIARYYTFPRFPSRSSILFYSSSSSFSYRQLPVLPSFSRRATPAPPSILSRALPSFSYVSLP